MTKPTKLVKVFQQNLETKFKTKFKPCQFCAKLDFSHTLHKTHK